MAVDIPFKFDEIARSERYFVSTLLTHLLMADDFKGLKTLVRKTHDLHEKPKDDDNEDFEVVTELDPVRDVHYYDNGKNNLLNEHGRVAVPDMFLRWGKNILVIEAKFFTDPADEKVVDQVREQQRAIEIVKKYTEYQGDYNFKYAMLTTRSLADKESKDDKIIRLTWEEIVALIDGLELSSLDNQYCLQ